MPWYEGGSDDEGRQRRDVYVPDSSGDSGKGGICGVIVLMSLGFVATVIFGIVQTVRSFI